jgi:hypothetical protein
MSCLFCEKKSKLKRETPPAKTGLSLLNRTIIFKNPEPVNITDPNGTVLFQFALGVSDVLVSDPNAASECQLQHWMVDQPTIQEGTAHWFEQLTEPLVKIKDLIDVYALQPVCQKSSDKLKGWLAGSLDKENGRYQEALKANKTYENVDYPDPYGNQSEVVQTKNATNTKNKKRVFLKSEAKKKAKNQKGKSKTKDWWAVLSLSLPLVPYHLFKYKSVLEKMMTGFVFVQFNEFTDCIARSIDTGKEINDNIVGYRSLMIFLKRGGLDGFSNVFSLLICNWNRFLDHINTLDQANKETDPKKKWFLYGQAMGKFVVAVSTGTNLVTKVNNNKKK